MTSTGYRDGGVLLILMEVCGGGVVAIVVVVGGREAGSARYHTHTHTFNLLKLAIYCHFVALMWRCSICLVSGLRWRSAASSP